MPMKMPPFPAMIVAAAIGLACGCAHHPGTAAGGPPGSHGIPTINHDLRMDRPAAPAADDKVGHRAEALARYATGLSFELKGEPEKALDQYYQSALAEPRNFTQVLEVARRLLNKQEPAKAEMLLAAAAGQPDAPGQVDALLGVAYAQNGKRELAIGASRNAIHKLPGLLMGYQNLVRLYLQEKQPREALLAIEEAARQPSGDPAFHIDLADLFVTYLRSRVADPRTAGAGRVGEPNSADIESVKPKVVAALEAAAKLSVSNPILLQRMADAYMEISEFEKSAAIYQDLLKRFEVQPAIRDSLRARLTDVYLRGGDRKKAADLLDAIVRNDPTNPQAYYVLGLIAYDSKEYDKAVGHYEHAILFKPDFEDVYYQLSLAHLARAKAEEALAILERARTKFPRRFVQEFYSALACNALKKYPEAIRHLIEAEVVARATEPTRLTHVFYFQLGATHERNKDFEQAERYFQECLKMDPEYAEALNYLGYMWAERGVKLPQALELTTKAVKLEPENAAFLDSLGWALFKLGRHQEALGYIEQAVKKSETPDATLYDHLGDIRAGLKQNRQAREAWKKSIEIESNPEVQKKLDSTPNTEGP